jgi:SAM-dependent methyltransferase
LRQPHQFSLFGTASGKGLLFSEGVLGQYLDDAKTVAIQDEEKKATLISNWLTAVDQSGASESSLEARFFQDIMVGVLGYVLYPAGTPHASLFPKPPKRVTHISRTPDALLGLFSDDVVSFFAALELKSPGTNLDLPQARESSETPVEQGFYYGRRILGVRWVLVSDMKIIRLYAVESQAEYEEFQLKDCIDADGRPTEAFRRLHFLLHHDYLVAGNDASAVAALYLKTNERQMEIRDSFYAIYYDIRSDLHAAISTASASLPHAPDQAELLEATQRLLDRLLFIYYCEDHPQRLIARDTVKGVTISARGMPGPSPYKVYEHLKHLFREVDAGSPPTSGVQVTGYNGELFKEHWIIDHISLPDSLHDKRYVERVARGDKRVIRGVWGLHEFDFWVELNEHLLGHIFEESLSDLIDVRDTDPRTAEEKLRERKRKGIYYTSSILSDFLSESSLMAVLNERAPLDASSPAALTKSLQSRSAALLGLRVLDPACGSGAFLVSAFREMQTEYWRIRAVMEAATGRKTRSLFDDVGASDQAALLRGSLFGVDLLPQAVEIAKLALWLRSARKGEKVADLGGNIVAGDSLRVDDFFSLLGCAPGSFDLVVGNPPWGSTVDRETHVHAQRALGATEGNWDSWELFVMLGIRALREGGRLAFVVPDSFFYPEKKTIREFLLRNSTIEKVLNLGAGWFGKLVRMGTVLIQVRRGKPREDSDILAAVLAGSLRIKAIQGRIPLTQIEAQRGRKIPLARSLASPQHEIEVLRGKRDDKLMAMMDSRSIALATLCEHARGEEMNKAGVAWLCPSCLSPTVPGKKKKGGFYHDKPCPSCGHLLAEASVRKQSLILEGQSPPSVSGFVPFIDGDDVARRYRSVVPTKWLDTRVSGWTYKRAGIYSPPKIIVRQAGIGVVATIDHSSARTPQSIYVYRLKEKFSDLGYSSEYLLAALSSRAMAYYVFKRFAEIDPAKSHAKLTHQRLSTLPIPKVDFTDRKQSVDHGKITENVRLLLGGRATLGGREDREIEMLLRDRWGIAPADGAYINGELFDVPESQVIRDLFPNGRRATDGHLDTTSNV